MRDNAGGDDGIAEEVTGRFVDRPVVASVSFLRTLMAEWDTREGTTRLVKPARKSAAHAAEGE